MARKSKKQSRFKELFGGDSYTLALSAILLFGLLLTALFYSGPYLSFDDHLYIAFANQISANIFNPISSPWAYGWLFPYFVFLGGLVFGTSSSGLVALTVIEYLSLIVLTYILALRVTKDRKLALLAAFLVCIFPFTIQYSTRVLSDSLMGVIASLCVIFFLSDRKIDWALAGAMVGLLIYIKLIALAFLVPFFICALVTRKREYVIPPMIVMLVIYTLPFLVLVHNPLYPFQNYGTFQETISPVTYANNLFALMIMASMVQTSGNTSINYQNYQLGLLLWLALLGAALAIRYRDKRMLMMAGIFWFFLLYLAFGTISLSGYVAGSFITRYLQLVAAPMAVLVAYAIISIAGKFPINGRGNWVQIAIFAVLMAVVIIAMLHTYRLVYDYNSMIRLNPFWAPAG